MVGATRAAVACACLAALACGRLEFDPVPRDGSTPVDATLDGAPPVDASDGGGTDAPNDTAPDAMPPDSGGSDGSVEVSRIRSIASGYESTCAVLATGEAWCWGNNIGGVLGIGVTGGDRASPVRVLGVPALVAITIAEWHACGIAADGEVWCWGENYDGQLGRGFPSGPELTPMPILGGGAYAQISAGRFFTCGVRSDGSLWCWGKNELGQVGVASSAIEITTPTEVAPGTRWTAISAGGLHACGIRDDHTLWCWGSNAEGEIGQPAATPGSTIPLQVGARTDWSAVSCGKNFTCALAADGTLHCFGRNNEGQLAQGDVMRRFGVIQVPGAYATVSSGWFHACAIRTGGTLACWGNNADSSTGHPSDFFVTSPYDVAPGFGSAILDLGDDHGCLLSATRDVLSCFGDNGLGQLGLGDRAVRLTPTPVPI